MIDIKSGQKEINQCDGCQKGFPIISNGLHSSTESGLLMSCTKDEEQKEVNINPINYPEKYSTPSEIPNSSEEKCEHDVVKKFCFKCRYCIKCHANHLVCTCPTEPSPSWEERICIVRAKNSHGALFQPCVYLDNTMVKDIETLKSFIRSTLATQEKRLKQELEDLLGVDTADRNYFYDTVYKWLGHENVTVDAAKIVKGVE